MISTIVWTLPRPSRSRHKGSFPLYFEENLTKILGYPERILHPFGGRAEIGVRVDIDPLLEPDFVADAHALPFEDGSFDCVILDPPYSDEEAAQLYGTPKLRPGKYTAEAVRVLREGGWLVVYTDREPRRPPRCNHTMRIVVVLRPGHRSRIAMVFQKRRPGMEHYGTETGEENGMPDPVAAALCAVCEKPLDDGRPVQIMLDGEGVHYDCATIEEADDNEEDE